MQERCPADCSVPLVHHQSVHQVIKLLVREPEAEMVKNVAEHPRLDVTPPALFERREGLQT